MDDALKGSVSLTMMTEYGCHGDHQLAIEYRQKQLLHMRYANTIYSGLNPNLGEHGIIVQSDLTKPELNEVWLNKMSRKIRAPLFNGKTVTEYQETAELAVQYSHDKYTPYGLPSPASRFLQIHREFVKENTEHQNVVMIGSSVADKKAALSGVLTQLIEDGYTQVAFVDLENKSFFNLHKTEKEGKTYTVYYAASLPHESMLALTALSGPLFGATGDQSFGEAVSANKLIVYECLAHKVNLIQDYDDALFKYSRDDNDIKDTLALLRGASTPEEYSQLGVSLRTAAIQEQLIAGNRALIANYNLMDKVMEVINIKAMTFNNTMALLAAYTPKNIDESKMLDPFVQLMQVSKALSVYDDKALIGLLLLTKNNSNSFWRRLSLSNSLHSVVVNALSNLGIDSKVLDKNQEKQYMLDFWALVQEHPDRLENLYTCSSLARHAGVDWERVEQSSYRHMSRVLIREAPRVRGTPDCDEELIEAKEIKTGTVNKTIEDTREEVVLNSSDDVTDGYSSGYTKGVR